MNDKDQNCILDVCDEIAGEINKPSSSKNTTYIMNNLDTSQFILEFNQFIGDPMKYFDSRHMFDGQWFSMKTLIMDEYRRVLAERDYSIKSFNYTLTNQNENITENLKSEIDNCARLGTSYTNISEHFNLLEDKMDNAKTGHKEVTNLVNLTANTFQENVLNISNKIQDLLKQVDMERTRTKKEQDVLKKKYSPDLISIKTNLIERTEEINHLKIENQSLLIKLNEVNVKLNEEEEIALSHNQHFENKLGELESNNILLNNLYKSKNIEYDEIKIKNQFLKDELSIMKTSIDENKTNLNAQLNIIKEQIELINNLKLSDELNDKLKNDNCTLNERNNYLKKINTDLMDDLSNHKISENKSQEEMENKLKNMCKSYDDLLKMQEEKLLDITEKLQFQKENEDNAQNEVVNLKQEAEVCNETIINLQEGSKANSILIPELQSKIDDLNKDLASNNQNLQKSSLEFMSEKNVIEKDMCELKNQSKEYFEKIEKLTSNYMKSKSNVKQMYAEVMRLRHQLQSESKSSELPSTIKTIEDNVSIVEPIDVSNINVSVHSISNINNKSSYSSSKRNDSPSVQLRNSRLKMRRMSTDTSASPKTTISIKNLNQKNDREINSSLNVSSKSNNQSYNNIFERSIEYNMNVKVLKVLNNTPQKENSVVNNESKIQGNRSIKNFKISNTNTNFVNKKMFKIPAELRPSQKKSRPHPIK